MRTSQRRRSGRGLLVVVAAIGVVALAGYVGYVAVEASDKLVAAYVSRDCTTPADPAYGWAYEAINYDAADDPRLIAENPDPANCQRRGVDAGEGVVAADGTRLAGWYIPAASPDPARPTVLLVHGHDANKSEMLPIAAALHDRYDLVLLDLRASGQSTGTRQTLGVEEQLDVAAILTWLKTAKGEDKVAALGVSGGAAAVLAEARTDDRIGAFIADSMHARWSTLSEQMMDNATVFGVDQPAYPGTWAARLGVAIRTGLDLSSVDPIDSLASLEDRPLLLLHGTADQDDVSEESVEVNLAEARRLGVDVALHYCEGAGHAAVIETCAADYGAWVSAFLDRAFAS